VRRLLALVLAAVALTGCGVRIDGPDPSPSAPTLDEVLRQREALRAEALAATDGGDLGTQVTAHAARQLEALGGVWIAWPQGDGPTPTPAPSADVVVAPGAEGLLAALDRTTPDLVAATGEVATPELARLFAAIATARTADAEGLAGALGAARELPALPVEIHSADPAVARALDAAAWVLEAAAARSRAAGEDPGPLTERASLLRGLGEFVVTANGWSGTPGDPREAWYPLDAADDLAGLEADLARVLVAAVGAPEGRDGLLQAARNCAALAARGGADVGPLPGL